MAVLASIAGGLIGASSANKAAKSQKRAAAEQVRVQEETRDLIRADLAGYREGGDAANAAYLFEMGLGPRPTFGGTAPGISPVTTQSAGTWGYTGSPDNRQDVFRPGTTTNSFNVNGQNFNTMEAAQEYANANKTGGTPWAGFEKSTDYNFRFDEGTDAINALAGARGGLRSGRTLQDLTRFGQGFASGERNNWLTRLAGVADTGMNAAAMQGNASTNAAAGISNALANRGNAQAAGAIGVGNALQGAIGNGLGIWNYQRQTPPSFGGGLFGGNSWG